MITAKFFSLLISFVQVKGDCLTADCEKISLDVHQDAVRVSEFVGHLFHNSVTLTLFRAGFFLLPRTGGGGGAPEALPLTPKFTQNDILIISII